MLVTLLYLNKTSPEWLIHVNVWQKPLQYCKVISLQLIQINGKKIKQVLSIFKQGHRISCSLATNLSVYNALKVYALCICNDLISYNRPLRGSQFSNNKH